jgi:alpha-beta hydrolase superfamily lysophospholipase
MAVVWAAFCRSGLHENEMSRKVDKRKLKKILFGRFSLRRVICSLVFVYVCMLGFVYLFADWMIFLGRDSGYGEGEAIVKIEARDGTQLAAIYLEEPNSEFTILYSHGNAEDIGDLRDLFELFVDEGYSLLGYDYRGYGRSKGRADENNVYEDVESVYEYLVRDLNTPPHQIIAMGRSVGAGAALQLACEKQLAGLILESAFVTAFRVITRIPLTPFDKFRNIDKIKEVGCPVLIIHGKADRIIPFWHGEKLFKEANEPKLKFWVDGAGHNDLFSVAGERYWEALKELTNAVRGQREEDAEQRLSE